MNRQKIPQKIETEILLKCRRRCCICFGLNRDKRIKQGQIAHLDKNRNNNSIENLAFLCLNHHDQYDSRSSQSKGLTKNEVVTFRTELQDFIDKNWNIIPLHGDIRVDIFSGKYTKNTNYESAELIISYLGGDLIHVKGTSLWGINSEYGPNMGLLDFVVELNLNKVVFIDNLWGEEYSLELEFLGNKLKAKENYIAGYFGMNVTFEGQYIKNL